MQSGSQISRQNYRLWYKPSFCGFWVILSIDANLTDALFSVIEQKQQTGELRKGTIAILFIHTNDIHIMK